MVGTIRPVRGALGRFVVTTLASLLIQGVTFCSGIALARGLEPTGRGQLAIAMQWPLILAGLSGLGVPEAVAFYSSSAAERRRRILSAALSIGVAQSVVAMGVGWLLLPYLLQGSADSVVEAALLYLLIIPLHPLTLYPAAVLQGQHDLAFNIARLSPHIGYTCLLLGLWLSGHLTVSLAIFASLVSTSAAA